MRSAYLLLFVILSTTLLACRTGSLDGSGPAGGLERSLVELKTRPGVTQKFILIRPPQPKASVILFAGGKGDLGLSSAHSVEWGKNNFLVRTRSLFAKRGLMVALLDAPSDRKTKYGLMGYRSTPEHVTDIEAVVAFLRKEADLPVWLVGTSRGTISAAHFANSSDMAIDGLVLTSTMFQVGVSPLSNIKVPTLVVAHKADRCSATPPVVADTIVSRLSNAPQAEQAYFEGGWPPESGPCKALSPHGFYGIEKKVVDTIAQFILENSRTRGPLR